MRTCGAPFSVGAHSGSGRGSDRMRATSRSVLPVAAGGVSSTAESAVDGEGGERVMRRQRQPDEPTY